MKKLYITAGVTIFLATSVIMGGSAIAYAGKNSSDAGRVRTSNSTITSNSTEIRVPFYYYVGSLSLDTWTESSYSDAFGDWLYFQPQETGIYCFSLNMDAHSCALYNSTDRYSQEAQPFAEGVQGESGDYALMVPLSAGSIYLVNIPSGDSILASRVVLDETLMEGFQNTGECGDSLIYAITDNTLIIYGDGRMDSAPWNTADGSFGNIRSIYIEGNVENICQDAFSASYSAPALKSVYVCSPVMTDLGDGAFSGQNNLKENVFPDSIVSIGGRAFEGCSSMTDFKMPSGVTDIGDYAFADCSNLYNITIAEMTQSLGNNVFSGCTRLSTLFVSENNPYYASQDGILYNKDKTELIICPEGNRSFTIPSEVIRIRERAFENNGIAGIFIPSGVTVIGDSAFSCCESLKHIWFNGSEEQWNTVEKGENWDYGTPEDLAVHFNEGEDFLDAGAWGEVTWVLDSEGTLTVSGNGRMNNGGMRTEPWYKWKETITRVVIESGITYIGDHVFSDSNLTDVSIAETVTEIGESAFNGCEHLTNVTFPENLEIIGYWAFARCTSLTGVTIPDSVTTVQGRAFDSCTGLLSIDVSADNPCYSSQDGVLFNKDKTLLVMYPGGKTGPYVIPDSVTALDSYAFGSFYLNNNLTNVTIPGSITEIPNGAFQRCTNLTEVTISKGVVSLGDYAFEGCTSLSSVTIPDGVTTIGKEAFRFCESLTSITLSDSVTSIGDRVFYYCNSLTAIEVSDNNSVYASCDGVLVNKAKTKLIMCPYGITGHYVVPDGVKEIGEYAFNHCSKLTKITIPDTVTYIERYAFQYCDNLTEITIPVTVMEIYYGAFSYCTSLTDIWYGGTMDQWTINIDNDGMWDGYWGYEKPENVTIHYLESVVYDFVLPENVRVIEESAFEGAPMEAVYIPDGCEMIGAYAFKDCPKLLYIRIPGTCFIDDTAFEGCNTIYIFAEDGTNAQIFCYEHDNCVFLEE